MIQSLQNTVFVVSEQFTKQWKHPTRIPAVVKVSHNAVSMDLLFSYKPFVFPQIWKIFSSKEANDEFFRYKLRNRCSGRVSMTLRLSLDCPLNVGLDFRTQIPDDDSTVPSVNAVWVTLRNSSSSVETPCVYYAV